MNSQNNLARYTQPTTPDEILSFSKNSGAINRYSIGLWVVQAIMWGFSVKPAIALLEAKLVFAPGLLPYVPFIASVALGFLHYVLHGEVLETLSNILDSDEETNNDILNWVAPFLIFVGLLSLDIIGTPITLRDNSFAGKRKENKTEAGGELSQAKADYAQSLSNIAQTRMDDSSAAVAPFLREKRTALNIKTYDADDRKKKEGKLTDIEHRKAAALAAVRTTAANATRDAQNTYLTEKNRIVGKRDNTDTSLADADASDETKSQGKGWIISIFLYILFLAMAYKLVLLRVAAGIRINVKFTELDAQGGFIEKLSVATGDILKRQGHRFLVWYHQMGSIGTATLHDFDGKVILKESSYNTPEQLFTPQPPTIPPASGSNPNPQTPPPPTGGNGGGGNGGGHTPTPLVPSPTKANSIPMPSTRSMEAAMVDLKLHSPLSESQFQEVIKLAMEYDKPRVDKSIDLHDGTYYALQNGGFVQFPSLNSQTRYYRSIRGFDEAIRFTVKNNQVIDEVSVDKSDDKYSHWYDCIKKGLNPETTPSVQPENEGSLDDLVLRPTPSVEPTKSESTNHKTPVITDNISVITAEEVKLTQAQQSILKSFRMEIQELNGDCRNYETKNGTLDSIANRIGDKLLSCNHTFQNHKDWIPQNVAENYDKAHKRAMAILKTHKANKEVTNE
jgi:hypothetical protein